MLASSRRFSALSLKLDEQNFVTAFEAARAWRDAESCAVPAQRGDWISNDVASVLAASASRVFEAQVHVLFDEELVRRRGPRRCSTSALFAILVERAKMKNCCFTANTGGQCDAGQENRNCFQGFFSDTRASPARASVTNGERG